MSDKFFSREKKRLKLFNSSPVNVRERRKTDPLEVRGEGAA